MKNNKLILLLFTIALYASSALALTEKHIVFDVQGTIVQGVPWRKAQTMKAEELITTHEKWGGNDVKKHWGVLPNTREAITRLYELGEEKRSSGEFDLKISFFSSDPDFRVDKILQELKLTNKSGKTFYDIAFKRFYRKDTTEVDKDEKDPHKRWKKDLSKISKDYDNIILVTWIKDHAVDENLNSLAKNIFWTGNYNFFYDTYYEASVDYNTYLTQKNAKNAWKEQHFPTNKDDWYLDRHKLSYTGLILEESLQGNKDLVSEVNERVKEERKLVTRVAIAKMEGTYKPFFYEWIKDQDKKIVTTCVKKDFRSDKVKGDANLDKCLVTTQSKYYWQENERKVCEQYTADLFYITEADQDKCENEHYVTRSGKKEIVTFFFVNGKLVSYIPEILDLRDSEVVAPSIVKKYDANLIARSLVKRINLEYENKSPIKNPDYDFKADSELQIAFWEQYLPSIKANCFMNQHQIGHSKGTLDQQRRARVEDHFLGVRLEQSYSPKQSHKLHVVRPKYAYFVLTQERRDMGVTDQSSQYGNIIAKVNDKVKERATFSGGDSLSLATYNKYREIKSIHFQSPNIHKMSENRYWEAQIWGDLCIDDHIDYFLVNCSHYSSVSQSTIKQLKKTGKKVYQCLVKKSGGRVWKTYRGKEI